MIAKAEGDKGRILVVDDDASLRETLLILLRRAGHEAEAVASAAAAIEKIETRPFDVVLTDVRMPGGDGVALLPEIRKRAPSAVPIVMTAYSTWSQAVEAMRLGAFDYVRKPFDRDNIIATVARGVRLARAIAAQGKGHKEGALDRTIFGRSPAIQELHALIARIAPTDSTVLMQGESGTGKELVARALHENSLRAGEPFVSVNCGAFPETLLESEMFGHMRGSFTGAVADKPGLLEAADKGTFFLDEVSEMSPTLQVKLLRMLEEREFTPVGATKPRKVDVRFVAATNRNLEEEVRKGRFREDLYYRLNVIPIRLPPLRERRGDIPLLAGRFLAAYTQTMRSTVRGISDEALDALMRYDWPGNVRELENCIQRAVALAEGPEIQVKDLDERIARGRGDAPPAAKPSDVGAVEIPEEGVRLDEEVEALERRYIEAALRKTGGNLSRAAPLLGVTFRALRYKVKKLGISVGR